MNAKDKLVKDLMKVACGYIVSLIMFTSAIKFHPVMLFLAILPSGMFLGWSILSKRVTALSFYGIVYKYAFGLIIGIPAMPIVLIKDYINYKNEVNV